MDAQRPRTPPSRDREAMRAWVQDAGREPGLPPRPQSTSELPLVQRLASRRIQLPIQHG